MVFLVSFVRVFVFSYQSSLSVPIVLVSHLFSILFVYVAPRIIFDCLVVCGSVYT